MVLRFFLLVMAALAAGCSNLRYEYRYIPGKTATIENGRVIPPDSAPQNVRNAIEAANYIANSPYRYGGGHGRDEELAFDCSGATSYVLRYAGALRGSMPSASFRKYGASGEGEWISVWARKGHVFLVIAGVRFDTGWHGHEEGPRWTTKSRPARGYVIRHPWGL